MSKVAIYCPFYITNVNKGCWVNKWIDSIKKYESCDVYYSISYPINSKWDKSNSNIDDDYISSKELINTICNEIPSDYNLLFNTENIEHSEALGYAHTKLLQLGYDYMIHIEQDVTLNAPIVNTIVNACDINKKTIAITDITCKENTDIDISIFCIHLPSYSYPCYNQSYHDIETGCIQKIKSYSLYGVYPSFHPLLAKYTDNQIKETYIQILNELDGSLYNNNKKFLHTNPFNMEYIKTPMLIDVGRAFVINSKLNNLLYIHKNTNATHHKLSRIKNIPYDIKQNKRISIFCPFYITKNSNMLWIDSWKTNVLKYVNDYDVYYSISYPTDHNKWDVIYDNVSILDVIPNISLPNCKLLFNEPNVEHKDALNRMHAFAESNYDYLIHIEQDVVLNNNIIPLLIDTIEKNNTNIVIANTIPIIHNEIIDFDMSVFAINLQKIKSHPDLYNSILCDLTNKINIFDLHDVTIDDDVKNQYKKLLYTLFKHDDIYINYEKYINSNHFNDSIKHAYKMKYLYPEHIDKNLNITIPIYLDMGRKLVYDNFILNKLSILDNTNNILFTHMGHSRYTIPIQPTSILSNNINGDKNIIEVNNDMVNKQYPKPHPLLILNNNQPVKNYAIYCPFYITTYNDGYWITNWLCNVADKETAPIYYSISYANDVDITLYSNLINDLNNVGVCIFNEVNITHSKALQKAHSYLCDKYDYMIHIEQDVILQSPICNHLINNMIDNNSNIVITDIESNIMWDTPSDIDISIFAINLTVYDSNNYNAYFNATDITPQITMHLNEILHIDFNVKPPLLNDNSDIHTTYLNILDDIYLENAWWLSNISNLTTDWLFITDLNDITFVDVARTYIIDAYINNKLSIIKGVQTYAKHLKQSRYKTCNDKLNMDNIISIFGYPPHQCKSTYTINNIDIVIISQNQCDALSKMVNALKFQLPDCKRIFVLDRCSDNSSYMLSKQHEFFIERHDAVGFCAGTARNLGLQYTNPTNDVLFLDGDRIPHNISIERLIQMLYYFDISLIKNKVDIRKWFDDIPTNNMTFGKYDNGVWSSALLLRRSAINSIKKLNNFDGIFNPIFDGNWGGEDEYLGDMCKHLNMKCGGFPNFIYVDGDTTIANKSILGYKEQTEKRNKLRSNLFNLQPELLIGNQPYLNKDERRELINSIVSERRNVMRNMIKHRDRE